jgi:hypothetical protein
MPMFNCRFRSDERGIITTEAVVILPLIIWAFAATFVFFDALRLSTNTQKAAYTVADALSRRTEPVTVTYITGLNDLNRILARTRNPTQIRVSSIGFEEEEDRYIVIWSIPTGGQAPLLNEDIDDLGLTGRLPDFPEGETVVLVESVVDYTPPFNFGLGEQTFRQSIVTRPRFAPQVVLDDGSQLIFQVFGTPTCDDGNTLCNEEEEGHGNG